MPNWTYLILHFLHTLALVLWIGGLVAIGALTTPVVFDMSPDRPLAGRIMARIFRRFDALVMVCIVTLLTTSVLFIAWYGRMSPWYAIQYVCIVMMSASAIFSARFVTPRMRALRREGGVDSDRFDALHRTSLLSAQFNLVCGCVALFFS